MAHRPPFRDLGSLQCKSGTGHASSQADMRKIIHYWTNVENVNDAAWIVPLLVALVVIQFFGVRGYGEVSLFLGQISIPC